LGSDRGKDIKRWFLRFVLGAGLVVTLLYEYAERYPALEDPLHHSSATELAGMSEQLNIGGLSFAEELAKAKQEVLNFSVTDVKREYKDKYGVDAKPLLCSACKITAQRVGEELFYRNASGVPDPTALLNVTKEANVAACDFIPKPLVISANGRGKAYFSMEGTPDGQKLSGLEFRKAEVAWRSARRLCIALLGEMRWEMLETLIRRKVPHIKKTRGMMGEANSDNWERWLCAKKARLCRRAEVRDDDEDEDEGEL